MGCYVAEIAFGGPEFNTIILKAIWQIEYQQRISVWALSTSMSVYQHEYQVITIGCICRQYHTERLAVPGYVHLHVPQLVR